MENDYPLANTTAARMLAEGIARAKEERGLSVRQIGKMMGYKTAVVLSHMALGRAPIPIDRVKELANILDLDIKSFLQAVLEQRHPDVPWDVLSEPGRALGSDNLALELEATLGAHLKNLSKDQRAVMREVAGERSPGRRWLTLHELHAVEVLREMFPHMRSDGVDADILQQIRAITPQR